LRGYSAVARPPDRNDIQADVVRPKWCQWGSQPDQTGLKEPHDTGVLCPPNKRSDAPGLHQLHAFSVEDHAAGAEIPGYSGSRVPRRPCTGQGAPTEQTRIAPGLAIQGAYPCAAGFAQLKSCSGQCLQNLPRCRCQGLGQSHQGTILQRMVGLPAKPSLQLEGPDNLLECVSVSWHQPPPGVLRSLYACSIAAEISCVSATNGGGASQFASDSGRARISALRLRWSGWLSSLSE
jgi:hypothetical protein